MFYSNKEFESALRNGTARNYIPQSVIDSCKVGRKIDKKAVAATLKQIKDDICDYQANSVLRDGTVYLQKFTRPWDIIPSLRNFHVPAGDFSVGVEVEYGFTTSTNAGMAITFVRNWKHVAIDREGGMYGVETTFAPVLYSKLHSRSQVFRYIKFLNENRQCLVNHSRMVGTHINIGCGRDINRETVTNVNNILRVLSDRNKNKFFGRIPYGYGFIQGSSGRQWIEWKLFNSTTDVKAVKRYINIAVALTKLIRDVEPTRINEAAVLAALEAGYKGRVA